MRRGQKPAHRRAPRAWARPRPTGRQTRCACRVGRRRPDHRERLSGQGRASPARDEGTQRGRAGECRRVEGGQRRQIGDRESSPRPERRRRPGRAPRALAASSSRPPTACGNRTRVPGRRGGERGHQPLLALLVLGGDDRRRQAFVGESARRRRPDRRDPGRGERGPTAIHARAGARQPNRRRAGEHDPAVAPPLASARSNGSQLGGGATVIVG